MKCPGQDPRYWKFDAIYDAECPNCGSLVEFFKDETRRKCSKCGQKVLNPKMDFGCATHCKFAQACFGDDLPPELIKEKENLFKDRVQEEKADPAVVISAAYLHDIGLKEAERKYEHAAAAHHEEEGPPVARALLEKLEAKEDLIVEVCDIVGHHHHPRDGEAPNFKVVYDADLIVNIEEAARAKPMDPSKLVEVIDSGFMTESGRELARSVLLGGKGATQAAG
jgi:DNA-directed RNA polymerase subunit RPC12/RpoP